MTDVSKAISDTVVHRLKTPLIGAFIFSWLAINHSLVLGFTFETLPNKVALAQSFNIGWINGFWLPLIVSLGYIILIPALQLGLDWLILKTLGKWREMHDSLQSRSEALSSKEHQAKLVEKDLVNWEQERSELKKEITRLNGDLDNLTKINNKQHMRIEGLVMSDSVIKECIKEAMDSLEKPRMHAGSEYADQRTREEVCEETLDILEQVVPRGSTSDIPF
ncbi:hypothetical protein BCT07_15405 [Vibrio breoganii]|uniref:hypothetical protein n=1 Tax=Vibrio breoganii TaxID=553239 RepID=UPI000C820672|nr:hypothetical protein [Vibrio breoganii]PMO55341.1 hypothetical protein BCT07_15405 [Vibrio breoganii]